MMFKRLGYIVPVALLLCPVPRLLAAPRDDGGALLPLTRLVDPFIGTAPGGGKFGFSGDSGDVFPGALWPRGMVQWSPDTPANLPGGYHYPDTRIKGFSLTHFSGRGCTAYQDVPFMPVAGEMGASPAAKPYPYSVTFSHDHETAHPGLYQVRLDSGVTVALTATAHTGLGRFLFPATSAGTILVNAGGGVNGTLGPTEVTLTGDHEVSGQATSHVGCGRETYTVYFVAQFDRAAARSGTWADQTVSAGSRHAAGPESGAYLTFDTSRDPAVRVKTGISYVSLDNARANLAAENRGWDFDAAARDCDTAWNRVLNRVQAQGGGDADERTFYTALYHSFIHPNVFSDVNSQYRGFDGKTHTVAAGHAHYENIPGWDEYRTLIPLQALLAPGETGDVAQSLVDDARQGGGGMPRWQQTSRNSAGMCGDSPTAIIAGAYAFGARRFDVAGAMQALTADASDPTARSDGHIVREGLADDLGKGYIPGTGYHTASATLEYGVDDFALSRLAQALGDVPTSEHYLRQAQNWKNLFDAGTGYVRPRAADGAWVAGFQPAGEKGFVEGSAAQYTWLVPFNLDTLFQQIGGKAAAVQRLDTFFTKLNDGTGSPYAFMGNEPCEEVPWEYIWAGAPARTQAVVRRIQNELFTDKPNGFPGNDDGGAISSWYVFSAVGLYPELPGVAGLAVGSPRFPRITLHPSGGDPIQILAPEAAPAAPYVQSLTLDGQPYDGAWIPWDRLKNGATLRFRLGATASAWGTSPTLAPPSFDAAPNVTAPAAPAPAVEGITKE